MRQVAWFLHLWRRRRLWHDAVVDAQHQIRDDDCLLCSSVVVKADSCASSSGRESRLLNLIFEAASAKISA